MVGIQGFQGSVNYLNWGRATKLDAKFDGMILRVSDFHEAW